MKYYIENVTEGADNFGHEFQILEQEKMPITTMSGSI
jgi:hypothetical protein